MNKLTTSLLYLTSYLVLTGFSLGGFVDDLRFKGTSVGITKCVERNKQEGISRGLIRRKCIEENQKILKPNPPSEVTGRYKISTGTPYFEVTYKNKSNDKVITYFEVKVSHFDNKDLDGNQIVETIGFNVLIPPNSKSVKVRELDYLPDEFEESNDNPFMDFTKDPIGNFSNLGKTKQPKSIDYSFSMGDTYKGVEFILK